MDNYAKFDNFQKINNFLNMIIQKKLIIFKN